jgi:ectoine hydroxylase-related dioxygenase (phytanoyl-CoA dioxygenase family)
VVEPTDSAAAPPLALHPWNRGFEWQAPRGEPRLLTGDQVEQFDRYGFFVLPDVLTSPELVAVEAELDRLEAQAERFVARQEGGRLGIAEAGAIMFAAHLVERSELLRDLARHPTIVAVCGDLIGPDVRLYWDQLVYKKAEKRRRFPWHQDNGYTFVEPQQYLTVWFAITDATVDNGCPQVVPGVHRLGTLQHRYVDPLGFECFSDHPDARTVPVPAGSALVFSSLTPHLTGPNTTDSVRKAYILQYAPDGARTLRGDPAEATPAAVEACDDPAWQFPVLVGGEPPRGDDEASAAQT